MTPSLQRLPAEMDDERVEAGANSLDQHIRGVIFWYAGGDASGFVVYIVH